MSDSWQGLGWWQASDGKWYPPAAGQSGAATPLPAPLAVPELPPVEPRPKRRSGAVGPAVLIVGTLLLLGIGAGSAVGIHDAMTSTATTTTSPMTTPIPAAPTTVVSGSSSGAPSGSTPQPSVGVPPASPATAPQPSSPSAGPAPSREIGPPGELVTQAVAQNVLATTWSGYAQAMVAGDRGSLRALTTPSALNDSIATLDCGCLNGPMTYTTSAVSAPRQSTYPVTFMAGLSGTGYNQLSHTWWVVFTKPSATTPWVIASIAGYTGGGGLDGFTAYSDAAPATVPFPLQDAAQAYVDYFQGLDTTHDPGTGLPAHYAHDNILDSEVGDTTQIRQRRVADGLHETFTHAVDQVSPVFAQVIDGSLYGAMECFSVRSTDVVTPTGSAPIVQPADEQEWGLLVPPGSYASLTFTQEDDSCVEESLTSGITLDSESGGTYAISTTPAR